MAAQQYDQMLFQPGGAVAGTQKTVPRPRPGKADKLQLACSRPRTRLPPQRPVGRAGPDGHWGGRMAHHADRPQFFGAKQERGYGGA